MEHVQGMQTNNYNYNNYMTTERWNICNG